LLIIFIVNHFSVKIKFILLIIRFKGFFNSTIPSGKLSRLPILLVFFSNRTITHPKNL